jgi:hypothetical protein
MMVGSDPNPYEPGSVDEYFRQRDEFYKRRAAFVHPFTQHVLDIVQESGDDPIRITTVANRFAKETGHSWKSREEREDLKKQAFQIIGELIKGFLMERYQRKWVRWTPPDNPRRKAFEQKVEENLKKLPKPQLTPF